MAQRGAANAYRVQGTDHRPHGVCATSDESFAFSSFCVFAFSLTYTFFTYVYVFVFVFALYVNFHFSQVQVLNFDAVISELMKSVLARKIRRKQRCGKAYRVPVEFQTQRRRNVFATYSYSHLFIFIARFVS